MGIFAAHARHRSSYRSARNKPCKSCETSAVLCNLRPERRSRSHAGSRRVAPHEGVALSCAIKGSRRYPQAACSRDPRLISRLKPEGLCRWGASSQDETVDCGCGRPCYAMPLLHPGHIRGAIGQGASREELMEAIWVAAEMRAGAAYAHSLLAVDEADEVLSGEGT